MMRTLPRLAAASRLRQQMANDGRLAEARSRWPVSAAGSSAAFLAFTWPMHDVLPMASSTALYYTQLWATVALVSHAIDAYAVRQVRLVTRPPPAADMPEGEPTVDWPDAALRRRHYDLALREHQALQTASLAVLWSCPWAASVAVSAWGCYASGVNAVLLEDAFVSSIGVAAGAWVIGTVWPLTAETPESAAEVARRKHPG